MNRARWIAGLAVLLATLALAAGCFLLSRPPTASFVVLYNVTEDPLVVDLDASSSSDPDGDAIVRYSWNFGEDVEILNVFPLVYSAGDITMPIVRVRYPFEGEYRVTLAVVDETGKQSESAWEETIVLPSFPVEPTV